MRRGRSICRASHEPSRDPSNRAGVPVHQSGAVLAGVQRPGARALRGPGPVAARAGEVPRHLLQQPGRVLPGPRLRPPRAGGGRRRGLEDPRRPQPRGAARRDPRALPGAARARRHRARHAAPAARGGGDPDRRARRAERRRSRRPARDLPRAHLPRAHAAVRGPGAPVPVHLEPVPEPRGDRPRPGHRREPVRAREGPPAAPAIPRAPRRRAARADRGSHRGTPRLPVPRDGDRVPPPVPGHPRRGRRGRGGRGRGPPVGDRERAVAPAPGGEPGPPGGRPVHDRRGARSPVP